MKTLDAHPAHHGTLPNGLRVVVVSLPHLSAGYAAVLCRTGPRHERPAVHGISHLCEHMLFRGAGPHSSSRALNTAAEAFMGSLEAHTSRDVAQYGTTFRQGAVEDALTLLGHMVSRPRLLDLRVEKRVLLEEIQECFDEDGTEIEVDNVARAAVYPGQPAGLSIDGTLSSVKRLGVRQLRAHLDWHYVTGNMVVCVAGPVEARAVMRAARRAFSTVAVGPRRPLPGGVPVPSKGPHLTTVDNPGPQTALRLTFPAFAAGHAAAPALGLLRRVLDDGFTSRFQAELVDRLGLAYEMWVDVDAMEDHGVLDMGAQVTAGREARTVRAMLKEAFRLTRTPPTKGELSRARDRMAWALVQMHDHAASTAEWHGRSLLLGLESRPSAVVAAASAVRGAEVRAVAQQVLRPDALGITTVGPAGRGQKTRLRNGLLRATAALGR